MKNRSELLLVPPPEKVDRLRGFATLPKNIVMDGLHLLDKGFAKTLCFEIGEFSFGKKSEAKIFFHPAEDSPTGLRNLALKEEGYALTIDHESINIYAATESGFLYGAMTLKQLFRQFSHRVPCMNIADAPKLAHRGVQLSFPQGHTSYRHSLMKDLVRELARWKINAIYLYLESYFDFPSLPNTAGPGAMTAKEAIELDKLCKSYKISLIPQLNFMGHAGEILSLQNYSHLKEHLPDQDPRAMNGFNLCASSKEVKKLVERMFGDIIKSFSSEIIHVGGDEVSILGKCPKCAKASEGKTNFEFYSEYFGRIGDMAQKHGRKIGIWGDMILHNCYPPETEVQRKMLASLRKGSVIYDWHYRGASYDTLKFFVDQGFETIACSSSNLCYSSSMWPAQSENQKLLFDDAIAAKAAGGITTAWCNFTGLHEEHLNYLFATGAALLWSGSGEKDFVPNISIKKFEKAYSLQRYGLKSDLLMKFMHLLGDGGGPLLELLAPINGVTLRKCLFHTDNVLTFWIQYSYILRGNKFAKYRASTASARKLWDKLKSESLECEDLYLPFFEGPLLMHEHLVKRFEMTEQLYKLYDRAAKKQFNKPKEFSSLLKEASVALIQHLKDFPPIEKYLLNARKVLGLDRSSILRIKATKRKIRDLADYLIHLGKGSRPLPAFIQLNNYFLSQPRTNWYGDREHDWAEEPPRFQRYTIESGPWITGCPDDSIEPGPHFAVTRFDVSSILPFNGDLNDLACPSKKKKIEFTEKIFEGTQCSVHHLFEEGVNQVVYYVCRLRCSEAMSLEIGLGYDGPVKAWVDGNVVFQDPNGVNPAIPEQARLPVSSSKGVHEICVAMSSNYGKAFGIFCKVSRTDIKASKKLEALLPELELSKIT